MYILLYLLLLVTTFSSTQAMKKYVYNKKKKEWVEIYKVKEQKYSCSKDPIAKTKDDCEFYETEETMAKEALEMVKEVEKTKQK